MPTTQPGSKEWSIRSVPDLGRAIAGVRRTRGLTQQQLANDASVERSYLARLEAGASTLAIERSLRLLRRMGASVTVSVDENDGGPR
ncbi:MAG TPA: helix-turn-helix transcriptional regulator [Solirubrobacterales bacterium]|nr:helix-turn-helix transcriptional regulator [Solirubrobacterales bacterium]